MNLGDFVEREQVLSLHSVDLAEDGRTVVALWDLPEGRTGIQTWALGNLQKSHPIRVAD